MKRLLLTLAVVPALALFAERQPYERYQSIVDRQMFGQPPPGFDPTRPPSEVSKTDERAEAEQLTKEQEQIKSAIHFSVINVTPGGETAVGFTDNGDAKNPVHYYLKVGESRNGWLVKEADPVKATMTIARGDVEVSLSIGGNSASQPGAAAKAGSSANMPTTLAAKSSMNALGSLRGRRMLREQQRQEIAAKEAEQKAAENARREEERRIAAEEKAQREAELEAEREERRAQLQQIRDELRRDREARAAEAERDARPRDDNEVEPSE